MQVLSTAEGRDNFVRDSEALLSHFNWSSTCPPEKQRKAVAKQHGRSLLRLAQECLKAPQVKEPDGRSGMIST